MNGTCKVVVANAASDGLPAPTLICTSCGALARDAEECDERDSFAPEAAQIAWGRALRFIDSHM